MLFEVEKKRTTPLQIGINVRGGPLHLGNIGTIETIDKAEKAKKSRLASYPIPSAPLYTPIHLNTNYFINHVTNHTGERTSVHPNSHERAGLGISIVYSLDPFPY